MEYQMITDESEALKAVEQDGLALLYVQNQTEAICIKAVEENGDALRYVRDRDLFNKLNQE